MKQFQQILLVLVLILQILNCKNLSPYDIKQPYLSKQNLVGTYTIGDECSNIRCSESNVFNYWLDYPLMCPQSETKATIKYNQKENFYTLTFEAHFVFSSNVLFEIDFDDMFFYGDNFIMIPMKQTSEFINLVIQPCGLVGQMDFIDCSTDSNDFQLVVSRQRYSRYGYSENDNGCQFTLTKVSEKVEKLDIEKQTEEENKKNQKNNKKKPVKNNSNNGNNLTKFEFPLKKEEIIGQYTVNDQCSSWSCDPLYAIYPITPGGFDNYLKCPVSDTIANIRYNEITDSYALSIQAGNGWFHTNQSASFEFSKINFYTEKSLIYIPLMDRYSGSDKKGNKFYYDLSSMTIMPCWLQGSKTPTSKNCSKNKNVLELSIQKWINKPLIGEPCGFTITKIQNQSGKKAQKHAQQKLNQYIQHYKNNKSIKKINQISQLFQFFHNDNKKN